MLFRLPLRAVVQLETQKAAFDLAVEEKNTA
jgi:hypothetical protein